MKQALPSEGTGIEIGSGSGRFSAPLQIKFGVEPSEGEAAKKGKKMAMFL
jgi:hypothetical protein